MKRPCRTLFAVLLSATAAASSPLRAEDGATAQESLSCAGARDAVAAAVCASPALSAAGREMAALYAVDRVSAFGAGPSNEAAAQRRALDEMRGCAERAGREAVTRCLQRIEDRRSFELATAAVMRSPDLALPVLRRTDPAYAPVIEAVALWASEPVDADWSAPVRAGQRSRILALLGPAMGDLLTRDDETFGRQVLTDPAGDGLAVKRVEDVLIDERHFARFLQVIGPYLKDSGPYLENGTVTRPNRPLPCAAVVRHPALLAATESIFGSTFDTFVFGTDCEQTLPPTPALTALVRRAAGGWPACGGTVRYAIVDSFATGVDAARLGRVAHGPKMAHPPRPRGVGPGDIAAARRQLAGSYARYLGRSRAAAEALAADAVADILSGVHGC